MAFYEFGPGRQREVPESVNTSDADLLDTKCDPEPIARLDIKGGAALPTGLPLLVATGPAAELIAGVFALPKAGFVAEAGIEGLSAPGCGPVTIWRAGPDGADGLSVVLVPHNAGPATDEFGGVLARAVCEALAPTS